MFLLDFLTPGSMVFWIVAFPVIGFALIATMGKSAFMQRHADKLATAFIGMSLVLSTFVLISCLNGSGAVSTPGHDDVPADAHWVFYKDYYKGWLSSADTLSVGRGQNPLTGKPGDPLIPGDSRMVISIGVLVDNFTAIMLFMVTLVATMVHLFSTGYMHGEIRYVRFFCVLQIFTAAMLGLLVSDNLITLYVCWELMGFASYALIGHYYEKPSAQMASIKAFMTTRVGDVLMFIGMMIIWSNVGSLRYEDIYAATAQNEFGEVARLWAGLLVFAGAMGKSAQFPLHVWLPDAMEGPTPVSALIHAATMVAAGVYLVARMTLMMTPESLLFVAYVGGFTALFAATIAVAQDDIKKVLAYSTISQLGYMMLGLGLAGVTLHGYSFGVYHLLTHAFFKACLFLGSGSIIHAMHHEQRMSKYGGLAKKLPITFATFLISTLCLTGLMFTSGFYSKDGIIASTIEFAVLTPGNHIHFLLPFFSTTAALFTAFYMFRLIFLTFAGKPRDHHAYDHAHESGWQMAVPLVVLATAAIFAGLPFSNGQWFLDRNPTPSLETYAHVDFERSSTFKELKGSNPETTARYAGRLNAPGQGHAPAAPHASAHEAKKHAGVPATVGEAMSVATGSPIDLHPAAAEALALTASSSQAGHGGGHSPAEDRYHHAHSLASNGSVVIFLVGVILAALYYWEGPFKRFEAKAVAKRAAGVHRMLLNKYWVDEFYVAVVVKPMLRICDKAFEFDEDIIDGAVNGIGAATIRIADVAGEVDKRGVDGAVNKLAASVNAWGGLFARWQTGNLRDYLATLVGGFVLLAFIFLIFPAEAGLFLSSLKEIALASLDWLGGFLSGLADWMANAGAWVRDFFVYFADRVAAVFQDLMALFGGSAGTAKP
jgi:NADH-quinone oxidoreductase subunit L